MTIAGVLQFSGEYSSRKDHATMAADICTVRKPTMHPFLHSTVLGLVLLAATGQCVCPHATQGQEPTNLAPSEAASFVYPHRDGQLSFPQDEGKHSPTEWPFTLIEWFAHYTHLTADDGTRYFLFSTFVTFDPVEEIVHGKFPHLISTFVDVTSGETYHHRDMDKLKEFAAGHASAESATGDYFRWKGNDRPFLYDYHVARHDEQVNYALDLELEMVKPPLAVNGTGYIALPKGTSGYYSQTRLKATGDLVINGEKKRVQGIHWIDRQWLGASFVGNLHYSYEWWALQLNNNEEAIMFRIWDANTDEIAMTWLEINHADGKQERVEEFDLKDVETGWHLSAPQAGWDLKIVPACDGQPTWQSCDVTGTIQGKRVTGMAVAELARDVVRKFSNLLSLSPPPKPAKPAESKPAETPKPKSP